MRGSTGHVMMKLKEAKRNIQEDKYIEAYEAILDAEKEIEEENEQVHDVVVSDSFDSEKIEDLKDELKGKDVFEYMETPDKMRLVVGYIDRREE